MAKGAVDLDDRVMVFSLFPTCTFLCVMVKQINFNFTQGWEKSIVIDIRLKSIFDCEIL